MDADAIRRKSFTRVLWGYAPSEVEVFLQDVAAAQEHDCSSTGPTIIGAHVPSGLPRAETATGPPNVLAFGLRDRLPTGCTEAAVRGAAVGMMENLRTVLEEQLRLVNAWLADPANSGRQRNPSHDDDHEGGDDEGALIDSALDDGAHGSAGARGRSDQELSQVLPGAGDLSDLARRLGIAPTVDAPGE